MAITEASRSGKLSGQTRRNYRQRIAELREYGELEGIALNPDSEKDFWAFAKRLPAARAGALVLMENGNLRAVWDGGKDNHLALQFRGGRQVQYVIFRRRPRAKGVSRVAGADTFDGVLRQIAAFELNKLVFG